jgi:SpoVK/Ycf46/Vps4 family AAA+-type ATPase
MQRVVPQILAELEGIESKNDNLLFVGATNEPWSIDPAALRPGRFDEKIYVPPPDYEARKKIFELNLKGKPLADIDLGSLADLTEGYSGADLRHICVKASLIPFKESIKTGEERGIAMDDMRSVMEVIKPSINREMVKKYEEFKF